MKKKIKSHITFKPKGCFLYDYKGCCACVNFKRCTTKDIIRHSKVFRKNEVAVLDNVLANLCKNFKFTKNEITGWELAQQLYEELRYLKITCPYGAGEDFAKNLDNKIKKYKNEFKKNGRKVD